MENPIIKKEELVEAEDRHPLDKLVRYHSKTPAQQTALQLAYAFTVIVIGAIALFVVNGIARI